MVDDDADARPPTPYLLAVGGVTGGVLWGVWISLVGQPDLQDDVVGIAAAAVGLLAGWLVSAQGRAVPQFRRADLATIAGFAPRLVTETVAVYLETWRRVRGRGAPAGTRTVPIGVNGGGWRAARRSGVVGALLSFTPASVCTNVDADEGTATVHDFVAR